MVTKLHGSLKREVTIQGIAHIVVIDEKGLKLTIKGRRLGQELSWEDLANGDAALATALNASLSRTTPSLRTATRTNPRRRAKAKARP